MVKSSSVCVSLKSGLLENQLPIIKSELLGECCSFDLYGLSNDFLDSNICLVFEK